MKKHAQFHGSDLEEIEKIYHIPKEEIVCFGANVRTSKKTTFRAP